MNNHLFETSQKIQNIVNRSGSISLSHLESSVDASFNLIFLAMARLVDEKKIYMKRGEWDYIISVTPFSRA